MIKQIPNKILIPLIFPCFPAHFRVKFTVLSVTFIFEQKLSPEYIQNVESNNRQISIFRAAARLGPQQNKDPPRIFHKPHANRNHSITTAERTSPRSFITSTPPFFSAFILDLFLPNSLLLSLFPCTYL
uniref:Uncharacterized protein n=1 Tax=Caenorhabditis japonica TaxID=281687 RepID=A0A8R1E5Y1_CAEJA